MISSGAIAIIIFTALVSAIVSGVFGMAGGQIFLAVLLFYLPVPASMVIFAVVQIVAGAWRAALWRRYVHWPIVWRFIVGSFVAFLAMRQISFVPSKAMVYLGIGLMPFAAFALPAHLAPAITRRGMAFVCGALVMVLQLVVGQAGNMLDIFFQTSPLDRKTIVATKAIAQLMAHGLRILYFGALAGDVAHEFSLAAWATLVAATMAGTSLATIALNRMTDAGFRKWTKVIIACFSAIYVARGLWLIGLGPQ